MRVFYTHKEIGGKNEPLAIEWPWIQSLSLHAEMAAIISYLRKTHQIKGRRHHAACMDMSKNGKRNQKIKKFVLPKKLVVIGYYKGKLHNSRPCDHCIRIMRFYGVKKVIYSTGLSKENAFVEEYVCEMEFRGVSSGNR